MHKIVKIGLSFLLILSIILNPLGSLFDIIARAVNPLIIEGIKYAIVEIVKGVSTGIAVYLGYEATEASIEAYQENERVKESALRSLELSVGVELESSFDSMPVDPDKVNITALHATYVDNPDLTAEEKAFANYFVNYVNSHPEEFQIGLVHWQDDKYDAVMTPEQYTNIKNSVYDMYSEYSLKKIAEKELDVGIMDMVNNGVLPQYDFSFVGPQPSISAPVMNGIASLQKDGFIFTPPIPSDKGRFSSQTDAMTYLPFGNDVTVRGDETNGFLGSVKTNCYGYSRYVLYNGTLYYYNQGDYTGSQYEVSFGYTGDFGFTKSIFYASDGTCLADVYNEGDSFSHGFCVNTTGQVPSYAPTLASATEKDFISEIGGSSVGVLRTDSEDTIGNCIGLGILNPDSLLEIGADGSIVGADGIELAKLQELCDLIKSGNLQFEDIQQYLDLITKLIGAGNMTSSEQLIILGNIEELTTSQAKSIDEINAAVTSISAALTIDGELDLDTPDVTVIDKFPFCLPFDLYNVLSLLCQEPKEPIFEIPIKTTIKTGGLNYEIDECIVLDFTIFRLNGCDMVQIFTQTCSTLFFIVCLIFATKKLMWS